MLRCVMDSSNHWYGHAHLLAEYCEVDHENPPVVWGVIQHGWNVMHGFGPGHLPPRSYPKFVWSHSSTMRGHAVGWDDYVAIGAPWLYLTRMIGGPPDEERSGTIFYPFHAWDEARVEGDHAKLVRQVVESEEPPITVCLYVVEYEMPNVRRIYEDAGVRVTCHGQRGNQRVGTDTDFLKRQYRELTRHKRAVSNRLTTAILYGASVGCDVGVYGDPMTYVERRSGMDRSRDLNDVVQQWFPELHGHDIDRTVAQGFAMSELGEGHVLPPAALAAVLGWSA